MKLEELRSLSIEELTEKVGTLKKELFDLRMKASAGKLEKSHQFGIVRKDLARALTLIKERQAQEPQKAGKS